MQKKALWPNETLLKARILNDGGYQKDALALLNGKTIGRLSRTWKMHWNLPIAWRAFTTIWVKTGRSDMNTTKLP